MRLVVTGRDGQVAASLLEAGQAAAGVEVIAIGRPQLDLARPDTVIEAIAAAKPDIVVSAAAYTAVDQAEDEPDLAFAVNAVGAGKVAQAAAELGVPVIHLSTDYVFDGTAPGAYVETDATAPRSVYGASKLAGEQAVASANPRHLILRTAWVYSPFGKNFVKTMLRLAADRDEIAVVADQWGNPTSALDIADGIFHMARHLKADLKFAEWGVYHVAGDGDTNWAEFAQRVFVTSLERGRPYAAVRGISTSDYPTKAKRPANSRLNCGKMAATFGWRCRSWYTACDEVVERLTARL
ncbi:dTDP-4-dehydrorhamnose reductase [Mesorhizobium sp. WSM1497]|uniref:dTDP-4-dehydrorhamnose reductase n=1 Tax=Mesorhizobium sp. WSM1497 TaxID=278153 RepID=UPI0007ECF813|nr:dTDP-4-dehydrorhamnose reductase [Mesorhizobium sp. WSM1497]ARP66644.1 dTDP-4-dehydrorhamnose reductase [Mesorhizobium sp. WSM1497]